MCYVTIEGNLESSGRRRLKSPFVAPPEDNLSLTLSFVCSAVHQLSQQVPFQHPRWAGSGLGLRGGAGRRYPAPPRPLSVSVSPSVKWGHTRTLLRTEPGRVACCYHSGGLAVGLCDGRGDRSQRSQTRQQGKRACHETSPAKEAT